MESLVLDDDFSCRKILQQILREFGRCDCFAEGEGALAAIRSAYQEGEPYKLLCLDIRLPGLKGSELLKQIREEESKRGIGGLDGIKVLMVSGLTDKDTILEAFRNGCEAYLVKPIDRKALLNKLHEFNLITSREASASAGKKEVPEEVKIFLLESFDLLEKVEAELLQLEADPQNIPLVQSIFRSVHTIKGNSGFLELKNLEKICHRGEALLDCLRNGTLSTTPQVMEVLFQLVDLARFNIGHIELHCKDSEAGAEPILASLETLIAQKGA